MKKRPLNLDGGFEPRKSEATDHEYLAKVAATAMLGGLFIAFLIGAWFILVGSL